MQPQQSSNVRITHNEQDFPAPEKPTIGIHFFNVNSGEERICDSEALITAFYNSSNLHKNAMVGQDMGWRLGKETIRRMRAISDDEDQVERIVRKLRLNDETELTDSHILYYIFQKDTRKAQKAAQQDMNRHQQAYEDSIRSLDNEDAADESEDTTSAGTVNVVSTARPTRRLSAAEEKLLADARTREANIEAGRDPNFGLEGFTPTNDELPNEDADIEAEEAAELARMQAEEDKANAKKAKVKKEVAKPETNSDNKS